METETFGSNEEAKRSTTVAESQKKPDYNRLIVVTVDTSPTRIGCLINQVNIEEGHNPIRFGGKVLSEW